MDSSPSDGDDGAPAPIVAVQQPLNLASIFNPPAPPKPLFAPAAQENSSGKGKDILSVLLQLSKQGYLKQGAWKNVAPPRGDYAEAWAVKCMLELCEYVCTEDDKASMAGNNSLEEEELVLLASSIEKKLL